MEKISIIVPIYNLEKYVGECIESIINQTYKNIEVILVDDGSLDNSFKVCKKYLSHFQKSVFRGEITPSDMITFKKDLNKVLDKEEDFVCIIKLLNDSVFGEEVIGKVQNNTGEDLII